MRLPPRSTWIPAAVAFVLLAWLYGSDLIDSARAKSSEVAALTGLPNPFFAGGVLLFALAALAMFVASAARHADADDRGYRLLPILAVLVLFVDLFVLPSPEPALPAFATARAIESLAQGARAADGRLHSDPAALEEIARRLGTPQYLSKGARVTAYSVEVRTGCTGPSAERGNAAVGTLIYCLNEAKNRAWITAVGLPDDQRFGPPAIFTVDGRPYVGQVGAGAPPEPPAADPAANPSSSNGGG